MIDAAAEAARDTDKGPVIAAGIIDALRQARSLLPAISTIEHASIAGRARARKQAAHALLSGLRSDGNTSPSPAVSSGIAPRRQPAGNH
jgi:hypothetical protein